MYHLGEDDLEEPKISRWSGFDFVWTALYRGHRTVILQINLTKATPLTHSSTQPQLEHNEVLAVEPSRITPPHKLSIYIRNCKLGNHRNQQPQN